LQERKIKHSGFELDDYLDQAILWTTVSALLVIPLIFSYFDFTAVFSEPRIVTLHLAAGLIAILWAWQIALRLTNVESTRVQTSNWDLIKWAGRNPARWALIGAAIWVLAQVAATLLSSLPVISFFGGDEGRSGYNLYDSLSLITIFLSVALRFRSIRALNLLVYTLIITGTISASYGIAQHFNWDPIGGNIGLNRVQSSFGNTLNFAGYLVMTIPATLALAQLKRSHSHVWISVITVALSLQLAGIYFASGRGPFIAAAFSIISLFSISIALASKRETLKAATILLISILLTLPIIFIPTSEPVDHTLRHRLIDIGKSFNYSTDITTNVQGGLTGRFNIWGSSLKLATQWDVPIVEPTVNSILRPLFGLGPDMYVYSYPMIGKPSSRLALVDHAHNYELQILLEQGFIGFIGFAALTIFLTICVFKIAKRYRERKSDFDTTGIIILALLPAMIGKLFDLQTGVARVSDLAMTFALFGAAIAIYELLNQQIGEDQNKSMHQYNLTSSIILPAQKRKIGASVLAVVAITILIISVFISWDVRRLSASLILSRDHDNPNLNIRAKAWDDAQAIAPERSSITFKLFEAYLATAKEQYNLGNVNEAMRLLMAGRDMLLVYEQRDPLELDIQIGLSKTTSTLSEWGHEEFMDELTYRSQKLASIAPAYPTLLGTSATAMASVGLHELAIEYAERAIATEETTKPWSKAWYAKGRSLYALGKEGEAIIALTTATEKEPGTEAAILAHKILGEIYRERGNVALSEMHITLGNADITVTN